MEDILLCRIAIKGAETGQHSFWQIWKRGLPPPSSSSVFGDNHTALRRWPSCRISQIGNGLFSEWPVWSPSNHLLPYPRRRFLRPLSLLSPKVGADFATQYKNCQAKNAWQFGVDYLEPWVHIQRRQSAHRPDQSFSNVPADIICRGRLLLHQHSQPHSLSTFSPTMNH